MNQVFKYFLILLFFICNVPFGAFAADEGLSSRSVSEQQSITVTGTVTDDSGETLPGVSVAVMGTTIGTVSDGSGRYSITAPSAESVLIFSFIGFNTQEIVVGNRQIIDVTMSEDVQRMDELVVVGYGVQRRETVTGSVVSIKGDDLVITRNENVQNMLTGRVAGVRVVQRSSEPGVFNNHFDIRGVQGNDEAPLIIIDGIPRTMGEFQRLDPNDIEDISILKDASASIYGVRAANGVVLITTRRGDAESRPRLTYSGSFTFQIPADMLRTVNPVEYMTIRNNMAIRNVNGGTPRFSDEEIESHRNGSAKSYNWHELLFAKWAPQTQHNLNVSGGTERSTYFVGLGYMYQEGFFTSRDNRYNRYNLRTNISTRVAEGLTFDINLSGTFDQRQRAWEGTDWIIRGYWRQNPLIPPYADEEETRLFHGLVEGDNPLAWMDADISGYRQYGGRYLNSAISLKYEIPGVKGLDVRGMFSYDFRINEEKHFRKAYNQYRYQAASETYSMWTRAAPNRLERNVWLRSQALAQFMVNYNNVFDRHRIGAVVVLETQKRDGDNLFARRNLAFPLDYLIVGVALDQEGYMDTGNNDLYSYSNNALAGRFNYAYHDRYLLEFLFRYDGSSRFSGKEQWGFFPGVSAGWRISEEEFFRASPLNFISQLKIRASYGETGSDAALNYQFLSGYTFPSSANRAENITGGYVFGGNFIASATNRGIPNEYLTWQTTKTYNFGVDVEAWRGLLGVTFDYFERYRDGQFATRTGTLPRVVGASLPQENLNSDKFFGFELELKHRNRIDDIRYTASGNIAMTRRKRLHVERSPSNSSWNNWRDNHNDRLQNWHRGWAADGRYESWEDIWNSPVHIGRGVLPGDYRYYDWNGDGEINGQDEHMIGFNDHPWLNYAIHLGAEWKGFDLNLMFQGSALARFRYNEALREPLWGGGDTGGPYYFYDQWHPVGGFGVDPWDTTLQWVRGEFPFGRAEANYDSEHNMVKTAYLRLKTVELGYTIPVSVVQNLRIYVSGYNLLTFSSAKYFDPERPEDSWGNLYPLNKTITIGLNLTF